MTVVGQLELQDVTGGCFALRQEILIVAYQYWALVLRAGERQSRVFVRRPESVDLSPARRQIGQVLLHQQTVAPWARWLSVYGQNRQRAGALAADGSQQVEIRIGQFEVADDVFAHRPLRQQIGEPALGGAFLWGEFPDRQRQGTGDSEAAACDPLGIVAKPDRPGRIAPELTDQARLVPDVEDVGVPHRVLRSLPVR